MNLLAWLILSLFAGGLGTEHGRFRIEASLKTGNWHYFLGVAEIIQTPPKLLLENDP